MTFLSFQSSDSEVRRLSEQLSQKDETVQKLQKEKEHLVELSQVRAQWELWRVSVEYLHTVCSETVLMGPSHQFSIAQL